MYIRCGLILSQLLKSYLPQGAQKCPNSRLPSFSILYPTYEFSQFLISPLILSLNLLLNWLTALPHPDLTRCVCANYQIMSP